jgi:hypothetical protein
VAQRAGIERAKQSGDRTYIGREPARTGHRRYRHRFGLFVAPELLACRLPLTSGEKFLDQNSSRVEWKLL